jgi:hypothetical protein
MKLTSEEVSSLVGRGLKSFLSLSVGYTFMLGYFCVEAIEALFSVKRVILVLGRSHWVSIDSL